MKCQSYRLCYLNSLCVAIIPRIRLLSSNIKGKNNIQITPSRKMWKLSFYRTHFGLSLKYSHNFSIFTAIRLSFSSSFFTFHKTGALSYLPILKPFFPPYLIFCCTLKRVFSSIFASFSFHFFQCLIKTAFLYCYIFFLVLFS